MQSQFESDLSKQFGMLSDAMLALVLNTYRKGIKDGITSAAKGLRSGGEKLTTMQMAGDLVDTMAQEYDVSHD